MGHASACHPREARASGTKMSRFFVGNPHKCPAINREFPQGGTFLSRFRFICPLFLALDRRCACCRCYSPAVPRTVSPYPPIPCSRQHPRPATSPPAPPLAKLPRRPASPWAATAPPVASPAATGPASHARSFYFDDGRGHRLALVSAELFAIPAGLRAKVLEAVNRRQRLAPRGTRARRHPYPPRPRQLRLRRNL